jgi:hypothetical protein
MDKGLSIAAARWLRLTPTEWNQAAMPQHVRYADGGKNERAVIKFIREDLLWRGRIDGIDVPVSDKDRVVGPTILDMIVRREVDDKPVWSLRQENDLFERDISKRTLASLPVKAGLVSGGKVIAIEDDFVRITKMSSVSIGAYAFRLAVGALGSIRDAHAVIASKAAAAWTADLARSRSLYQAIKSAPKCRLAETAAVAELRPAGSISDEIETDILREACLLLGVDPDLNIKRPPGRPRKSGAGETEAGDFISVNVLDGIVTAKTIKAINGIAAQTDLSMLTVLKLVSLLDTLLQGGMQADAELLEAYLDAAAPEWRETANDASGNTGAAGDDPYAILGVSRGIPFEDISRAYRKAMQVMHPDKGACPPWFAQMAANAYRRIKEEMRGTEA